MSNKHNDILIDHIRDNPDCTCQACQRAAWTGINPSYSGVLNPGHYLDDHAGKYPEYCGECRRYINLVSERDYERTRDI